MNDCRPARGGNARASLFERFEAMRREQAVTAQAPLQPGHLVGSRVTRALNWEPGIGDPTIGGWVTVVLYLPACVSCWKTAEVILRRDWNGPSDSCVWRAISIAFFFLGIN